MPNALWPSANQMRQTVSTAAQVQAKHQFNRRVRYVKHFSLKFIGVSRALWTPGGRRKVGKMYRNGRMIAIPTGLHTRYKRGDWTSIFVAPSFGGSSFSQNGKFILAIAQAEVSECPH